MKTILRGTIFVLLGGLCAMPLAAQDSAMSAKPKAAKPKRRRWLCLCPSPRRK